MDTTSDTTVSLQPKPFKPSWRLASPLLAALMGLVGLLAAIGWAFDIDSLRRLIPDDPRTTSGTAIDMLLLSISIRLIGAQRTFAVRAGQVLAVLVGVCCAVVTVETLGGFDWGTVHTLFTADPASAGLSFPGPLAVGYAVLFILLAVACLLVDVKVGRRFYLNELFGAIALLLSMMTVIGHATGSNELCNMSGCIRTNFQDSLVCALGSLAVIMLRPARGGVAFVLGDTIAGAMLRRVAVLGVLMPVMLYLRLLAVHAKMVDEPLGWSIFGVSLLALMAVAFAASANVLGKVDTERRFKERLLEQSEKRLEELSQQLLANRKKAEEKLRQVCLTCEKEYPLDVTVCPDDGSNLARISRRHYVGEVFGDRYRLSEFLGEGGMSTVYKAEHISIRKQVAIKVISNRLATDAQSVRRLQMEARAAGGLKHPNIVGVYDFNITEEGEAYMVMDFLSGKSLSDVIRERKHLGPQLTVSIFCEICDGLDHAHKAGIVHRDLKPSNIMLVDENGRETVKIVDFGIARDLTVADSQRLTSSGELIGSPPYMSPEQCTGQSLDSRSDIYSLGCMLYECLCGRPPFVANNIYGLISMHLDAEPVFEPGSNVPLWLQDVVQQCLRKAPDTRYATAADVKQALLAAGKAPAKVTADLKRPDVSH